MNSVSNTACLFLEAALVWIRFSCALGCWEEKTARDCCTFLVAGCMESCQTRAHGDCTEREKLRHLHEPGRCHAGWQWHRRWVSLLGIHDPDCGSAPWERCTLGCHQQKHLIKQTTREWWQQRQYFQFPGGNSFHTKPPGARLWKSNILIKIFPYYRFSGQFSCLPSLKCPLEWHPSDSLPLG